MQQHVDTNFTVLKLIMSQLLFQKTFEFVSKLNQVSGDPESDDDSGPEVDEFGNPRIKFQKNPRRSSFSELPDAAEPTVPVTVEGGGDEVVYEGGEVLTKSSAPGLPVNFDVAKIEREKDRNKSKKGFKTMKTTDLIRKPQADDTATPVHTGLTRPVNWYVFCFLKFNERSK